MRWPTRLQWRRASDFGGKTVIMVFLRIILAALFLALVVSILAS
jgi:hypothetical protein